MSDTAGGNGARPRAEASGGHGEHGEIHMPPNSWIPVSTSLALMVAFVGMLPPMGPWVGIGGAAWLAGSVYAWLRAARSEYLDLPESGGH